MLRSTVFFLIVTYTGTFLSLNLDLSSFKLHFSCPLLFLAIYALHAGYLFVIDTLPTPTITEPPSVECQDLLIPCQIECMSLSSQNRPWFIVPSERLSNEVQVLCLCYGNHAMTNRNRVFCFHYLCFHS